MGLVNYINDVSGNSFRYNDPFTFKYKAILDNNFISERKITLNCTRKVISALKPSWLYDTFQQLHTFICLGCFFDFPDLSLWYWYVADLVNVINTCFFFIFIWNWQVWSAQGIHYIHFCTFLVHYIILKLLECQKYLLKCPWCKNKALSLEYLQRLVVWFYFDMTSLGVVLKTLHSKNYGRQLFLYLRINYILYG